MRNAVKKVLAIMVVCFMMVACGVQVPNNPDVTYDRSKDYFSNLFIDKIHVIETGDTIGARVAEPADVDKVVTVMQSVYKGVSVGDTVDRLDAIYGNHLTSIAYYGDDMRFGKHMSVTFVWGDEEVELTVPASYDDNNKYLVMPLQVNEDMMKKAYKMAKDINLTKEEMEEEVAAQFFQPTLLIKNGEEGVEYVEFEKATNIEEYISLTDNDIETNYELAHDDDKEFVTEILVRNQGVFLPFNNMSEDIDSLSDDIYVKLKADLAKIDAMAGNKIGAFLSVTYYKHGEEIATLYYALDEELFVTEDISLEFKNGKTKNGVDVLHYALGL